MFSPSAPLTRSPPIAAPSAFTSSPAVPVHSTTLREGSRQRAAMSSTARPISRRAGSSPLRQTVDFTYERGAWRMAKTAPPQRRRRGSIRNRRPRTIFPGSHGDGITPY